MGLSGQEDEQQEEPPPAAAAAASLPPSNLPSSRLTTKARYQPLPAATAATAATASRQPAMKAAYKQMSLKEGIDFVESIKARFF